MPTLLWDVRGALVTILDAALDVPVLDGPQSKKSLPKAYVLIGTDGGDTGSGENGEDFGTVTQTLSDLGPGTWRDETGDVTCSAWAWTGSTSFAPLRVTVQAILDGVEASLRADPTLGGLLIPPGRAELGAIRLREDQTDNGARLRAVFSVAYRALLTT